MQCCHRFSFFIGWKMLLFDDTKVRRRAPGGDTDTARQFINFSRMPFRLSLTAPQKNAPACIRIKQAGDSFVSQ
jgi:hypothetical protein